MLWDYYAASGTFENGIMKEDHLQILYGKPEVNNLSTDNSLGRSWLFQQDKDPELTEVAKK